MADIRTYDLQSDEQTFCDALAFRLLRSPVTVHGPLLLYRQSRLIETITYSQPVKLCSSEPSLKNTTSFRLYPAWIRADALGRITGSSFS